jgi:hypothetical protein
LQPPLVSNGGLTQVDALVFLNIECRRRLPLRTSVSGSVGVGLGHRGLGAWCAIERALAIVVVVQAGPELETALIAVEAFAQVDKAVDGFLRRPDRARGLADALSRPAALSGERENV